MTLGGPYLESNFRLFLQNIGNGIGLFAYFAPLRETPFPALRFAQNRGTGAGRWLRQNRGA